MKFNFTPYLVALICGLLAGLTTLFIIPSQLELIVWLFLVLFIGVFSHYHFASHKYRKTFVISVLTGMTITLTHLYFIKQYLITHQEEIQMLNQILINNSYRLTLLIIAPVYWIILGLLTVLIHYVFEKLFGTKRTFNKIDS